MRIEKIDQQLLLWNLKKKKTPLSTQQLNETFDLEIEILLSIPDLISRHFPRFLKNDQEQSEKLT